jgi:hypothetical protein
MTRSALPGADRWSIAAPIDDLDEDLTADHMRILQRFEVHPLGTSIDEMAEVLDLDRDELETLCAELVEAGMIEQTQLH